MTRPDSTNIIIPFLVACLSIAIYASMDVLMKGLSIGIGAYNAVIWRTAAGTLLTGVAYLAVRPKAPSAAIMRIHIIRSFFVSAMAVSFFWGLARLPMAEAISLAFIAPLLATFMAAFFLGEKLDRRSIIASLLGFSGVLVIVAGKVGSSTYQPGALFAVGAIFGSAICYAYNLILARKQAQLTGPLEIAFYQNLFVTLILAAAAPWLLIVPKLSLAPHIIGAAAMASVSIFLLSWAYARAETQVLATTEYTGFLWAMLYGWIFFSEPVKLPTIAGAVLIVTACLFITRRKAEAQPPEPIAP